MAVMEARLPFFEAQRSEVHIERLFMRYTDDDIEAELRSRTHADAYWLQQSAVALFLAQHLATPLAWPTLLPISLIWAPICVVQLLSRHSLSKLSDPALGYRLGSDRMVALLVCGCVAQWLEVWTGSLEPVPRSLAIFYYSHFFLIFIMFHLTHTAFRLRVVGHAAGILAFSTLGWGGPLSGSRSFSERGQPFDSTFILLFNTAGALIGNFAELIVRRAFMATFLEKKRAASLLAKLEQVTAGKEAGGGALRPPPLGMRKRRRL